MNAIDSTTENEHKIKQNEENYSIIVVSKEFIYW